MSKNNTYIDWKNWDKDSFAKTSKLEEAYFNNIVPCGIPDKQVTSTEFCM